MMSTIKQQYDTIVVGLGAAGATAATTLAKAGKRVLALEAQDRIGGRVHTVPFGDGVVELGAEWIHGILNSRIYETAIKNNITILEQEFEMKVYRSDGTLGDEDLFDDLISYCLEVIDNPPEDAEPLGRFITRKFMTYVEEKYPKLLNDTEFIEEFLDIANIVVNGYEGSNDWNDITSESNYVELEGSQEMSWHRYGYKTFFELLLNTYNNGPGWPTLDIQLNKEVKLVKWPRDSTGDVEVTCADGSVYTADNVIVTVSLGVLKDQKSHLFKPSLTLEKMKAIDVISIGVMNKIMLKFDKLDLPRGVFYGFLWRTEDRNHVSIEDRWVTQIFGASTPLGASNVITLWTSGTTGMLVESMPSDVVLKKSIELIRKFMWKVTNIPEPTGILMSKWFSNPFARGSYSYDNLMTMEYPDAREILGAPLRDSSGAPKVLFAGEATSLNYFSAVHGACESGLREAKRILPSSKL